MISLVLVASPLVSSAAECESVLQPGDRAPSGWGIPYEHESEELILAALTCTDEVAAIKAGARGEDYFIFPRGFVNDGSGWEAFRFVSSEGQVGPWLTGEAQAVVPLEAGAVVAVYMCKREEGTFRCGCRTPACLGNHWTYQRIERPMHTQYGARWLMGYYPSWDRTRVEPRDLPFDELTHLAFGSVGVRSADELNLTFGFTDDDEAEDFAQEVSRRAKREGVVPLLFLGGATHGTETWKEATSEERAGIFAATIIDAVEELGYEGVDIDWEPLYNDDIPSVTRLVRELKRRDPELIVTVAIPHVNGNSLTPTKEYGRLARYADRINSMTYDMSGTWPGWESWHHAALAGDSESHPSSIEGTVEAFLEAGVPREKLGIGAPLYGYCWQGNDGPRQAQNAETRNRGAMSYRLIMREYYERSAEEWDREAASEYLSFDEPTGEDGCQFITYVGERGMEARGEWVTEAGLGGIIAWSLGQGHMDEHRRGDRHPLIEALSDGLK
ncbi:hypothetical protein GVX82_01800 [Patescibacteria group bacterium]|nr:hypothetical protein [Patescibacteria group bacterium]